MIDSLFAGIESDMQVRTRISANNENPDLQEL